MSPEHVVPTKAALLFRHDDSRWTLLMDFGVVLQTTPPVGRVIELAKRAEENGFTHVWVYDSHVLWQEAFIVLGQILAATDRICVGTMVTNPGTRDWTVLASCFATLNDHFGPRTICGIGRGDSALRVIGRKPRTLAEMADAIRVVKGLVRGDTVDYQGTDVQFPWVKDGWDLPVWGAGYGPRALACIGRNADGFILQLADPQILDWTLSSVREAAIAAGRQPSTLSTCVAAPAYVGNDRAHQREQLRWFGGMVGNHVADLVSRYGNDSDTVPKALTDYIKGRQGYDYAHHGQAGNPSTDFVPDDIIDRFCVLGDADDHIRKLEELGRRNVDHFAVYLMHDAMEETLDAYGAQIIPALSSGRSPSVGLKQQAPQNSDRSPVATGYSGRSGFGVRPALLVVDFIRGFTDVESGVGRDYGAAIDVTRELLVAFRAQALPVFFTSQMYERDLDDGGIFLKKVPALGVLRRGSPWVSVDDRLRPNPNERLVEKQFASAFFGTMLDTELRSLGVDTVVMAGCTTGGNVRASALDAMQHGFRSIVVSDAVGDRTVAAHESNLSELDAKYADVVTGAAVISKLMGESHKSALAANARESFYRWWHES
jgi:probable F420-dependent oxidoreductase